jgi:tripartite-type tricarboxylate transporter receptor subunit TctC
MLRSQSWLGFVGAALLWQAAGPASAQGSGEAAPFFKGKTLNAIVGFQAGSSSDVYLRTFTRHVARHLPGNPNVVVQNMPGAGSLVATMHMANLAARDGSVIALANPGTLMEPLINPQTTKFDPRQFGWIGNLADEHTMCGMWAKDISTFDDLKKREIAFGATGGTASSAMEARLVARILGLKHRVVEGYRGLAEVRLAAERGEVDGHCALYMSILKSEQEEQFRSGRIKIPVQLGLGRHPELANVPNVFEVAGKEDTEILKFLSVQWAIPRALLLPPGVPADRLAAWRAAFDATVVDPQFRADAAKAKLHIKPMPGAAVEPIIAAMMATPEAVLERTRTIVKAK